MKELLFLVIIIFTSIELSSQQISYSIPDIGTGGMNTYIEIIAPHNLTDNFGTDGIYLNNPGDNVRIELLRAGDASKISFGPLVVSWSGRMISTHAFVHPNVTPNSSNWSNLTNEFRIPFRIYVNGSYSNVDTFYIVNPFGFGDLTGVSSFVLGEGALGVRSRRGAMIVSNTTFANSTYTVSTQDCDPYVNGNQSYLPFVLLSTGQLEGAGSSTLITVSGTGKNAGPGGGGAGGNFCDAYVLNRSIIGEDGGAGFTGGGSGGRNNSGGGDPNAFQNYGISTGIDGASLNGIAPPTQGWYEASGGGTGHPFGISGAGCSDGVNCDPQGGYGGGSGYRQSQRGGSGGFRSLGNSTGTNNGGRIYGNFDGIPLAGGSGGGSGNPNAPGACSGVGGGGGGGIRISAEALRYISVRADGANGASSTNGAGGAGSGGYIEMGAKLLMLNSALSVQGGNSGLGGRGLIRVDAPSAFNNGYQPTGVEISKSLTTDTTRNVNKRFRITGSKRNEDDSLRIYIKAWDKVWMLDTVLTGLRGYGSWERNYYLPGPDSLYLICAVADKQYSVNQQFTYVPQYTMSQSAANIVFVNKQPEIQSDSILRMQILGCPGSFVEDTFRIRNNGDASLILQFNNATFAENTAGLTLRAPTAQSWVVPNDSVAVIVRYSYQEAHRNRNRIIDTLLIQHNDLFAEGNPQRIVIEITIDTIAFTTTNVSLQKIDTLDFGRICVGDSLDLPVRINNKSEFELRMNASRTGSNSFAIISDFNQIIDINDNFEGLVRFKPLTQGKFYGKLIIKSDTCDTPADTITLTGESVSGAFSFEKPLNTIIDTLVLGDHCVEGIIAGYFLIRNRGGQGMNIQANQRITKSDFEIDLQTKSVLLNGVWDTVYFYLTPKREGRIDAKIGISSYACGGYSDSLLLIVNGVKGDLTYIDGANFGIVSNGVRDTITSRLVNNGTAAVYITGFAPLNPPFSYLGFEPMLPVKLYPRDTLWVSIEFYPQNDGVFLDTARNRSQLSDTTCNAFADLPLKGISTSTRLVLSNDDLDFGVLEFCQEKEDSVIIDNPTTVPVTLSNPRIVGQDDTYFAISQQPGSPIIPVGGAAVYFIRFKPRLGPDGVKVAQFVVDTDFPKDPELRVDLTGEQENLKIDITPANVDFGSVPIGVQRTITVRLTNNGKITQNLIDIRFNNPDMTAVPMAALLAANGGFADIDIIYQPTAAGNADTDFRFIFRQQCVDSLVKRITASGQEGQIIVTRNITFPLNPPCADVTDTTLLIENTGASQVSIDSMWIEGPDRALFRFGDTQTFPIVLDSAEIIRRTVEFSPLDSPYGIKSAYIVTAVNVGNRTKYDTTYLSAEKRKFVVINPSTIDFGDVVIGQSRQLSYSIANVGNTPITITDVIFPLNSGEFTLLPNPSGTVINPSNSILFNVSFSPSAAIDYNDFFSVVAEHITNCLDTTQAELRGRGIPPVDTRIIISSRQDIDPTLFNLNIPIKAYITGGTATVQDLEFTAEISFNASLYALKSIQGASILSDQIIGETRYVEFNVKGLTLNNDSVTIMTINGRPMLGNTDMTAISWESFRWKDSLAFGITDTIPGELSIMICREGGDRLLNAGLPLGLSIAPNPADDKIEVNINMLETGLHKIELYNSRGDRAVVWEEYVGLNDNRELRFNYDLTGLVSGVYFIVLNSPTERIVKTLIISK